MRRSITAFIRSHRELPAFFLAGLVVTCVNWLVYGFFAAVVEWNTTVCNVMSWLAATTAAFCLNKAFVFRSKSWAPAVALHEAALFFGSRVAAGAAEIGLFLLLTAWGMDQPLLGVKGFAAKFWASLAATVIGFLLSKYAVFRKIPERNAPPEPPPNGGGES